MSVLVGLADVLGWAWRGWLCRTVEHLRPGYGHAWLYGSEPHMCQHCGTYRGTLYQRGRWT